MKLSPVGTHIRNELIFGADIVTHAAADEVKDLLADIGDVIKGTASFQVRRIAINADAYARRRPWSCVALAAALGVAFGYLAGRR